MAGANLSGDLREPSKAIPKGTLLGVSYTFTVYFCLFLLTGLTCNRAFLYHDCLYMSELEFWKPFVSIGALVRPNKRRLISLSVFSMGSHHRQEAILFPDDKLGCLRFIGNFSSLSNMV